MVIESTECRLYVNIINPSYQSVLDAAELLKIKLCVQLEDRTADGGTWCAQIFFCQLIVGLLSVLDSVELESLSIYLVIADVFLSIRDDLIGNIAA